MFIGHYAAAFAAKKLSPKTSLGSLFLAAQFLDLLWPFFLLMGMEHARIDPKATILTPLDFNDYPISHSLFAVVAWAVVVGWMSYGVSRDKKRALILGGLVTSHWFLDLLVHRRDLPLTVAGGPKLGLGLWNIPWAAISLEALLFIGGFYLYLKSTKPNDKIGKFGPYILAVTLVTIWLGNFLGPLPPTMKAVAWAGNLLWLFVFWAYRLDKHRT